MRFWRNTTIATLAAGQTATLPAGTLGYEWDEDLDNGSRPRRPDPPVVHDASTNRRSAPGLRLDLRPRHGDAQPDAVSPRERRARVRRRHGAVVLGARRRPRSRQRLPIDVSDAAGDGQPVRRHGRAARDAAGRAASADAVDRRRRPVVDDHVARPPGRQSPPATPVTVTGTASDTGGGIGRRGRGVDRRRRDLASGHGPTNWTYHLDAAVGRHASRSRAAAVDDSGNIETASARHHRARLAGRTCPCTYLEHRRRRPRR